MKRRRPGHGMVKCEARGQCHHATTMLHHHRAHHGMEWEKVKLEPRGHTHRAATQCCDNIGATAASSNDNPNKFQLQDRQRRVRAALALEATSAVDSF